MRTVSASAYAAVYVSTAVLFAVITEPELTADYFRLAALAATVVIVAWTVEVATVHHLNWRYDQRRQHGQTPMQVWGMGIAFLLALTAVIRDVVNLFHEPIRVHGLPLLVATLGFSAYWLWPLRRKLYERRAILREMEQ